MSPDRPAAAMSSPLAAVDRFPRVRLGHAPAALERDVEVLLQQAGVFHGFLPTLSFRCSYTVLGRLLSLATPTPSPLDGRVF